MEGKLKPVAYGLIFILLFTLLGFRVAHPKSGLKSAAGGAASSLVAYRHASHYTTGDKVVVVLPKKDISPAIGIVRSTTDRDVQVQTNELVVNVAYAEVKGKLIGVLPFIGMIFSAIGM